MINKRLMGMIGGTWKYIAGNVFLQWAGMLCNVASTLAIVLFLGKLLQAGTIKNEFIPLAATVGVAGLARVLLIKQSSRMSYLASKAVKKTLRRRIYEKLLRLGMSYQKGATSSEVVQVSVEGVEQLETYFGTFLPQLFYSALAPLTLFAMLSHISLKSALALLICVPIIPVAIAAVQRFAKKQLRQYWNRYTNLGDRFLENLCGLTTLKIYKADGRKHDEMNQEAEAFRRITMKVLTMQLNSIAIMDLVAFGGAALGVVMAVGEFTAGQVDFVGCLIIILLSAEFFIPMRQLGSYFHIAMNGIAASEKIFRLLDCEEPEPAEALCPPEGAVVLSSVRFSYAPEREILHGIDMTFAPGSFTGIVGESGSGKSTVASLLTAYARGYEGSITIGGMEIARISGESLLRHITYINHDSYLFKGTVRENLLLGSPQASDKRLWDALERVNLAAFLRAGNGLDTLVAESTANLSGGQRQRLALARALLHDSPVYIFDEATSNVDVESESTIIEQIRLLAGTKTVILISHRLETVKEAENIYVLENGSIAEQGAHEELLAMDGAYARLWRNQQNLERFGEGAPKA